jgi:hypothetical protein
MTKQRILTAGLIVLGFFIIVFFGMNTIRAFKHMRGRGPFDGKPPTANQTDVELIRDWMTIPYIGKIPDQTDLVIVQIKDTIKAFQSQERPPEPIPPAAPAAPIPSTPKP